MGRGYGWRWRGRQETRVERVNDLIDTGVLNEGQGNALITKLEAAVHSLDKGNDNATISQLGAFINAVEAAIRSGKLTRKKGQH